MKLPPFALERYFAPREFAAKAQLSCSDCEALSLAEVIAGADDGSRALWDELRLGYMETRGHPRLRKEIASLYDGVGVDDVLACAPSEGIFLAMSTLLSAGDRIIVTMPAYQSLFDIARGLGCTVGAWTTSEERCWRFDPAELRALLNDGARMVVVNFPHNPTGAQPTVDEWREIVDMVRAAGAWLFSDEMYRFLERDPSHRLAAAVEEYERGITLGGLSKAFGAPGLRSGWLACRAPDVIERAAERKDYTTICGSAPNEVLSILVLRQREQILARNLDIVADNVAAAEGVLAFTPPRAGCVALARVDESASDLCEALFHHTGVLMLPSKVFDFGDRHVRLGLGRRDFPRAIAALSSWMHAR
jgi:aspartate/methionine/tyrosine aminotransferase